MGNINEKLCEAARSGSEAELKALLRNPGCDPLAKDYRGMTALMLAAYHGHEACLRMLLPISDALAKGDDGITALMWATYHGHEACLRILLPISDALAKGDDGTTALMWASCNGQDACVRLLLPISNAFTTDEKGKNASMCAHNRGHKSLAQFIDAYALAQTESSAIGAMAIASATHKRAAPRV